MKIKKTYLCFILSLSVSSLCSGQDNEPGSWNIFNIKYKPGEKWSLFTEFQLRSLKFYNNFYYFEYKAGISYHVHPDINLTLGLGDYNTYKEGGNFITPMNNDEFRIWPQVSLAQSIGNFKIEHRYRAEFRFTSNGYRNRFRYRFGISLPLGNEKYGYKPFLISLSDELFITDVEPHFERNRILLSLGFMMSKQVTIQIGYLNQFDYKINGETGKNFMQLGLNVELFKSNKLQNS